MARRRVLRATLLNNVMAINNRRVKTPIKNLRGRKYRAMGIIESIRHPHTVKIMSKKDALKWQEIKEDFESLLMMK